MTRALAQPIGIEGGVSGLPRGGSQRICVLSAHLCAVVIVLCAAPGCSEKLAQLAPPDGVTSLVRNADLSPRPPTAAGEQTGKPSSSSSPFLYPGFDSQSIPPARGDPAGEPRSASAAPGFGAIATGRGVEINFDNADIQTVSKTLLGDILQYNFTVDPQHPRQRDARVRRADPSQGCLLGVREHFADVERGHRAPGRPDQRRAGGRGERSRLSRLRGRPTGIWRLDRAAALHLGGGRRQDGGELSLATWRGSGRFRAKHPLIQGTTTERQAAIDMVSIFDVEWLRNQSVGIYPLNQPLRK